MPPNNNIDTRLYKPIAINGGKKQVRPLATPPQHYPYPVVAYPPPYPSIQDQEIPSIQDQEIPQNSIAPPGILIKRKKRGGITKSAILHRCVLITRWEKDPGAEEIAKHIFEKYTTKKTKGEKYSVTVYKETQGETIAVYYYNDSVRIDFITHKLERLRYYYDYTIQFGSVSTLQIELYARIHKISEKKVELALEAMRKALGKGKTHIVKSEKFQDKNYLLRIEKFDYKGYQVSVKLYYDKHMKEDPKIEVLVKATTQTIESTLKTASTILHTLIKASNPVVVYNDYDKEQDKVELNPIDPVLLRQIRGTKPRVKAEAITEKQIKDKHLAVMELLLRGLKPGEIAKTLGYSDRYVRYLIKELVESGEIVRVGKGKYTLPQVKQKENKEKKLAPLPDIVNHKVEKLILEYLPRYIKNRETAIQYIKSKYPKAQEHPISEKYRIFPPVFYYIDDDYIYIKPIYY